MNEATLQWFIGLEANVAVDWDEVKYMFLAKYTDYCRGSGMGGDDIFKMQQRDDGTLEKQVSRFLYNLQRNTKHQLNEAYQKHVFLRDISETYVEYIDLMTSGDTTQITWEDIKRY